MKNTISILISFLLYTNLSAAEWQWSTEIKSVQSGETNACPQAFLWIPSDCKQVRGIVIGMHNMTEEGVLEHPDFRKTLAEIGFAEIWITPGLDPLFDVSKGVQKEFDEMLGSLAEKSGYSEIKFAPVVPIGHSACASFPWNFGAWNPDKTLAIISIHGDAPQTNLTGCGRPNLNWENRSVDGIPSLMIMGEYEWWEDRLTPIFAYKKTHPESPVSLLADAGHGHFDHSDMLVDYMAFFIKKAAQYRLPAAKFLTYPVKLKPVNPHAGWLTDRWHKDEAPHTQSAPYDLYKGNKEYAFWYFDKETAEKTEAYYAKARGKKEQYIGFVQEGKQISFDEKAHARMFGKFLPESDGLTFHIKAVFTDTLRAQSSNEHASMGKISLDRICGPVEKINDTTFTIRFYRMGLNNSKRTGDIWLLASHPGDKEYKSTVQQLNVRIPFPNKEGKVQTITFQALSDISNKTKFVELKATSDSNLPVYFYVKEGPADVKNGKLELTKIPPRSKYPVKVTVVAWQYGIAGQFQTAEPVEHSFNITDKK